MYDLARGLGGAQVKDAHDPVAGDGAEDGGRGRLEGGGVGAGAGGERAERAGGVRGRPDLNCAVPRRGGENVLVDEVPGEREHLARVFFPLQDGEVVEGCVEELYGAVAGSDGELVAVGFGEGDVKKRVLCIEAARERGCLETCAVVFCGV